MYQYRDEHYGLVSLLFYSLREAEVLQQSIEDARASGDAALVMFFTEVRDAELEQAARAKVLLRDRLGVAMQMDQVDEMSMESFPASDAPATY